jgi:hypothetical protein
MPLASNSVSHCVVFVSCFVASERLPHVDTAHGFAVRSLKLLSLYIYIYSKFATRFTTLLQDIYESQYKQERVDEFD